jgi:titin
MIDGATQTVFTGNTNVAGPEVVLNGSFMGFSAPFGGGLNIPSSGNHINSLVINGFNNTGISITGAGATGNLVTGCFLGTNASGTSAVPNTSAGMVITQGASNNVIGGTSPPARNLISGNAGNGMIIQQFGTNNNTVQGNFIGTDVTGTIALSNAFSGILIGGTANGNLVGGTSPGARNLISGNGGNGLSVIDPDSTANRVQGNFIGTDVTGNAALGNVGVGVNLRGAPNNIIGGMSSGAGNLISGNSGSGIVINTSSATGNQVQGNFIGTDVSGNSAIANGGHGVLVSEAANNIIGGLTTGARNVISGNSVNGISIGNGANGNQVQGNFIGTNAAGNASVPNLDGININSSGNTIGGTAAARNVISGNANNGVRLTTSGATLNVVQGNYIGTDASGAAALGNVEGNGIVMNQGASANQIGGTAPGAGNVASGNGGSGILCRGVGTSNNTIQGNFCGTNAAGSAALPNQINGIRFAAGTSDNLVGGTAPGARNIVSGNMFYGIHINDLPVEEGGPHPGTARITVQGNFIGTDASGTQPLGNHLAGVIIYGGASDNLIGGTDAGAGNVIAFNTGSTIDDGQGGFITIPGAGISVANDNNTSGDGGGGNSVRNRLSRNSIFSNEGLGIDLHNVANAPDPTDGPSGNDSCDSDSGPNNFQNFPVLTSVCQTGSTANIQGTLNSAPGTTFTVEFYANATCDSSGFGEGETYLGSTQVTTDNTCVANFTFSGAVPAGQSSITTTAVDPEGNTSEFSQCVTAAAPPTNANAGPDQSFCETSTATLAGNTPTVGTGNWQLVSGSATITDPSNPTTTVTNLGYGANVFRWTISNGACGSSMDDVVITRNSCNQLTAFGPATVWLGLKNSDDVGTKFDLLAEVLKNGALIGSGQLNDVPGGSSGFNNAVARLISLTLVSGPVAFQPGDSISIRLSVRIAASSGHRSGTARLWFNDAAANSRFTATISGMPTDYFLRSSFVLGTTPGPGPKTTIDVFTDRAVGGNPFKPFGTWSKTF